MATQSSGGRRRFDRWRGRPRTDGDASSRRPVGLDELRRRVVEEVPEFAELDPLERRLRVAAVADRMLGAGEGLLEAVDDLAGLGPLEELLADTAVTEIMVNGPDDVHVEVGGELRRSPVRFRDGDHLAAVVHRLLAGTGRRIDEGAPMVDARMSDGSRVNAVLPPVAAGSALLTIRRPARVRLGMEQLIERDALDPAAAAFLHAAVLGRCNLVVTGGAGAGKTTVLAALCELVPGSQRVLLLEDVSELAAAHPHLVRQQCRPAGPDGGREVALRDLVRNALRMRPDRLVVGEVRGPEAADMLAAMSTGHPGSMTTLHANTAAGAVTRLLSMLAPALPAVDGATLEGWIAATLDVVVHCERSAAGHRHVAEVIAVDAAEDGRPVLTTLYARERTGSLTAVGAAPTRCLERMRHHDVHFPVKLLRGQGVA